MDLDLLHELRENQCYLVATHNTRLEELEFIHLEEVNNDEITLSKREESFEKVLSEPIGNFMFRYYLLDSECFEYFAFLTDVETFENCPPCDFRLRLGKKICKKFLNPNAHQFIGFKNTDYICDMLSKDKDDLLNNDIFCEAKQFIKLDLLVSSFHTFLLSKYYARLLAFRKYGNKPVVKDGFTFIRILGEGGFGTVYAVSKKDTRAVYACKAMNKFRISQKKREALILNERNVLMEIHSPLIINLKYALQNQEELYLMIDLMTGGELEFHLKRRGRFIEKWVVFFAAGIVLAIEYLHQKNILFRDMKPQNVLLDESGFIRLTDLGLASFLEPGQSLTQHCGTPAFMAPEQNFGSYGKEVDWWGLGTTVYYMLVGHPPIGNWRPDKKKEKEVKGGGIFNKLIGNKDAEKKSKPTKPALSASERKERLAENMQIAEKKIEDFEYPEFLSENSKSLLKSIFVLDPTKRLGHNGSEEVKSHPFFEDIDWKKMERRHISPPMVPSANRVNAEFLQPAEQLVRARRKENELADVNSFFSDCWDYVSDGVFQEEVMQTQHNKQMLSLSPSFTKAHLYRNT